ncbi:MAG: hypothetical protein K0R62_6261 [Nonomuraea muscovyensis]|nr:hypothetical protein [Nonomuraea muscovyensis]
MGYELRRHLREALGPDITGLQRAVALEIADDANERTRRSSVPLEKLVLWTGAKDTSVVRNALKRLAANGWEFRLPIGKGKDGRVLYAVPGTRMTFQVPSFVGVAVATPTEDKGEQGLPHGGAGATPQTPQGGAGAHSEGAGAHSEGAGAPPSSSSPSLLMHEGAASEDASYGIPDAARPLIDSMTASGIVVRWPFTGNQWFPLVALINKCGIPALVEYARRTADRTHVDSARYFMRGWAELPPKPAAGSPVHTPRPHLRAVGQSPEDRGIF